MVWIILTNCFDRSIWFWFWNWFWVCLFVCLFFFEVVVAVVTFRFPHLIDSNVNVTECQRPDPNWNSQSQVLKVLLQLAKDQKQLLALLLPKGIVDLLLTRFCF
jgi:hypothetical protein